jgi:ubiquinone/menaquinone biosynthesis C-methylase UbiE
MNRLAFEQLERQPGERVLEVGFGGGGLLACLLDARAEVIAMDRSQAMLDRSRLRFARELRDGRLKLQRGSVEQLPLDGASVDKACSVNAIYFWADLDAAAGELARVLRPGGVLVLCFQTPDAVRRWPGHRHGFHAHSVESVATAMRHAGLVVTEERRGSAAAVGEFVCLKGVKADG